MKDVRGADRGWIRGALTALTIFGLAACSSQPFDHLTHTVAQVGPAAPAVQTAALSAAAVTYAAPETLKASDLYRQSIGGVFTVRTPQRTGTAFAISPTLLLTNRHVVDDNARVDITQNGALVQVASVEKVFAGTLDLAVLRLAQPIGGALALAREPAPVGEEILIIGSPRGLEGSLTRGLLSQYRVVDQVGLLQIDAAVNPGNSGSPVFDSRGRVIGIVFLAGDKAMGVTGINFAIGVDAIRAALGSDPRLSAETGALPAVAAR